MDITTTTHRLSLDETTGEFQVWPLEKRQLHVAEYSDGVKIRDETETHPDTATATLLEYANSTPLFAANWDGNGGYNLDLDCGCQRWNGVKSTAQIRAALRRCGFNKNDIQAVLSGARVKAHDWITRHN